jgi:hypothetical protein
MTSNTYLDLNIYGINKLSILNCTRDELDTMKFVVGTYSEYLFITNSIDNMDSRRKFIYELEFQQQDDIPLTKALLYVDSNLFKYYDILQLVYDQTITSLNILNKYNYKLFLNINQLIDSIENRFLFIEITRQQIKNISQQDSDQIYTTEKLM